MATLPAATLSEFFVMLLQQPVRNVVMPDSHREPVLNMLRNQNQAPEQKILWTHDPGDLDSSIELLFPKLNPSNALETRQKVIIRFANIQSVMMFS